MVEEEQDDGVVIRIRAVMQSSLAQLEGLLMETNLLQVV